MVSIFQSMETHGCDFARSWVLQDPESSRVLGPLGFFVLQGPRSSRVLGPQKSCVLKDPESSRVLDPQGPWCSRVQGPQEILAPLGSWVLYGSPESWVLVFRYVIFICAYRNAHKSVVTSCSIVLCCKSLLVSTEYIFRARIYISRIFLKAT